MSGLHIQIVSPASLVFEGEAAMVEVPGTEGDMGVLPGHVPTLSRLREGVVRVHLPDQTTRAFRVTDGYADISGAECTLLSESIEVVS